MVCNSDKELLKLMLILSIILHAKACFFVFCFFPGHVSLLVHRVAPQVALTF